MLTNSLPHVGDIVEYTAIGGHIIRGVVVDSNESGSSYKVACLGTNGPLVVYLYNFHFKGDANSPAIATVIKHGVPNEDNIP